MFIHCNMCSAHAQLPLPFSIAPFYPTHSLTPNFTSSFHFFKLLNNRYSEIVLSIYSCVWSRPLEDLHKLPTNDDQLPKAPAVAAGLGSHSHSFCVQQPCDLWQSVYHNSPSHPSVPSVLQQCFLKVSWALDMGIDPLKAQHSQLLILGILSTYESLY